MADTAGATIVAPEVPKVVDVDMDARDAFKAGDAAASRSSAGASVEQKDVEAARGDAVAVRTEATEDHGGAGSDFIKSIVFGGMDGSVTTFSIVAATFGGSLPVTTIITLGFANLIADAISMGLGDFLSSSAEFNHLRAERAREEWEYDNYPEGERAEVKELLVAKGFEEEDASTIVNTISAPQHKKFFVDYMMTEELGLELPDDPWGPLKDGLVTLASFLAFGSVPLWVYLILWGAKYAHPGGVFGIAIAATILTFYALGALQGKITRIPTWKTGLLMVINGSLVSGAAYLVGWAIELSIGNGDAHKSC